MSAQRQIWSAVYRWPTVILHSELLFTNRVHRKLTFDSDEVVDVGRYLSAVGSRAYVLSCLGINAVEQKFVITDSFRKLVEKLNSGERLLPIRGPKGVGKTMALAAIAALSHGKSPCLFVSPPMLLKSSTFDRYVNEIYVQYGKSKCLVQGQGEPLKSHPILSSPWCL